MIFLEPKHNALIYDGIPFERVSQAVPAAVRLHNGYVAIPNSLGNLQAMARHGLPAVAPMDQGYDWPGKFKPFEAQRVTASFLVLNPRGFCLSDMGTGKTMAALWAADYLMALAPGKRALIVAPLSTLRRVWGDAIWRQFIGRRKAVVLHGSAEKRLKLLNEDVDFYIINFEGLGVGASIKRGAVRLGGLSKAIAEREDINIVMVDEASAYRDANTRRHRVARQVIGHKDYLWQMTGTPTSNGPMDAYGLAKLAGSTTESERSYRSRVMLQVSNFKWVPKAGSMEEARKLMSPAVRFSIDECVDLPPCTVQQRECELTKEQAALYMQLKKEATIMIRDRQVTAMNEGVLRLKLLQIVMGAVYDEHHNASEVDASPRIALLKEVIAESAGKVIVFAPLTSVVNLLNLHISGSREVINGTVSDAKRSEIFRCFQETASPHVLIADPSTMAHGLTLTSATTVVWYGPTDRTELYLQANKRIHRPGQTRSTTIVQIVSTPIEAEIFRRLESNETLQGVILALAKGER